VGKSLFSAMPKKIKQQDTANRILHFLALGYSLRKSCEASGVSTGFYYSLVEKDLTYKKACDNASRENLDLAMESVKEALLAKDISTAKWYLERKYKEEFSTKNELEIDNKNTVVPNIIVTFTNEID
jgi:hypothetical protein